jgi:hypothetical protein
MFNSTVLEVVIGLIFIYLLYSLLATTIQELIASAFGFRSKILERAVFRMLEDETKFNYGFSSVFYLFKKKGNGGEPNSASYGFYNHPLIKFLGANKPNSKPSYINKKTFSKVITDLLRGDQVKPDDKTKFNDNIKHLIQTALDKKTLNWGKFTSDISDETLSYLNSIWADANGDIDKFKQYLEDWFDETMERATGWYKKHTQFILFFVGLTIAIVFNVDTIKIAGKLQKDPNLREQIVQQANVFLEAHPDLDKEIINKKSEFDSIQALIKSNSNVTDSLRKIQINDSMDVVNFKLLADYQMKLVNRADSMINTDIEKANDLLALGWKTDNSESLNFGSFLWSLLGWIITALAISLGAPFWYDLLNKFMKLRGSVATAASDDKVKKQG